MIVLYIVAAVVVCAVIGKLLTRFRDKTARSFAQGFPRNQRPWARNADALLDPVENPRIVDDGTDFGYKEFD